MDLLLIIYIFVLFIIFSPNFIFQSSFKNHMIQTLVHGLLFSLLFYLTYSQIGRVEKEGATIGTYESKPSNIKYEIETQNTSLGSLVPIEKSLDKTKTLNNEVIIDYKNDRSLDKLTESQPYDYINYRTYDYENMKKRIQLLDSHKHSNQYYDLVPNLGKKQDEVLCAANYGTNTSCCRQPHSYIPDENVCGALKPYCVDYIAGQQWGKCMEDNPHPKPKIETDKKEMETIIKKDEGNTITAPVADVVPQMDDGVVIKKCDTGAPEESPAGAPAEAAGAAGAS